MKYKINQKLKFDLPHFLKHPFIDYLFSKGFVININDGNKVRTETIAKSIAIPVNIPK